MRKKILALILIMLGVGLVAYPSIANWWNVGRFNTAIKEYKNQVLTQDVSEYREAAWAFNEKLRHEENQFPLSDELKKEYYETLDIMGTGIIGYIDIPSIKVHLPIYHGTDEGVLQVGTGHLEGSSLPTALESGKGVHCVITGHSGLMSARLFTDLTELKTGDEFSLSILDEIFHYKIIGQDTVLPFEMDRLKIDPEKNLCTLVTCTPYGVNTHRLLIYGEQMYDEMQNSEK